MVIRQISISSTIWSTVIGVRDSHESFFSNVLRTAAIPSAGGMLVNNAVTSKDVIVSDGISFSPLILLMKSCVFCRW